MRVVPQVRLIVQRVENGSLGIAFCRSESGFDESYEFIFVDFISSNARGVDVSDSGRITRSVVLPVREGFGVSGLKQGDVVAIVAGNVGSDRDRNNRDGVPGLGLFNEQARKVARSGDLTQARQKEERAVDVPIVDTGVRDILRPVERGIGIATEAVGGRFLIRGLAFIHIVVGKANAVNRP